jgi:E3 ubiquitin-protein ligase BAH
MQHATDDNGAQLIEIPLTSDSEFFHLLKSEVSSLDALQAQEEVLATKKVMSLGNEVAKVAAPSTATAKTDIYRWREIIDLYMQAKIFFSTSESDHGSRNSAVAQKQLQWFLLEIERRNLQKQFKRKDSPAVLSQFVQINVELLRNLRFQEINRIAMAKILKS